MARKRSKPKSPEQIALEKLAQRARDLEAVNIQPEAASLPSNENIIVQRKSQQTLAGARRWDCFDALAAKNRKPDDKLSPVLDTASYTAARQLERDMREQRGEVDRGSSGMRVDSDPDRGDHTDAMVAAGKRVRAVLAKIGDRDAMLLTELIYPSIPRETWRDTVAYVTGETHSHAQAAVVRAACANLAAAYSRRAVAA
jgi:hypothetical protein